ncbi:DUF192 domain-containing protein [Pseudalkalibacillus berkeleyi]|uniref:DUF192 domain-containing protein n=1 Tax=Pseudalkalibacillus berkeleyi TaxID=1069813 RepID=A0ABS9H5N0_9BACL|nr:DUF192 domain-containing protein [Pseudalkalibacillus berkeleyi]MCF6139275.1 DUF192 domain-containing protein [Pseudalkalibacillus berkeleyi]
MELINLTTGAIISDQVIPAYSFFKRLKGLMFTSSFPEGCAVHIKPCRSIHTYFMNFEIDVLYLSESNEVIALDRYIHPGQIGKHHEGTASVIELPAGTIHKTKLKKGHFVQIQNLKERVS